MKPVFVKVQFDVDCRWEGLPPAYRIYVNDELFTERTWDYVDQYLQELLQIEALPGRYQIRFESIQPNLARFWIKNRIVVHGPAEWTDNSEIIIHDET